jgi:Rod binding domain-containing protein
VGSVNQAGMSGIVSLTEGAIPKAGDRSKIPEAARQFEALLIGQILHSAHSSDGGWLGSGEDSSGSSATDFAEEQLANTMAQSGGFGLATVITKDLER